jgi:formate-dependent nitrite reductase membrane component NrfD
MHVKPWEWMVKPTPQEEWIEGKGLLSWLSFFSVAIGAGMYFVAVILNYPWAMVTGYLVCLVVGGGTKFVDLGKPTRAWRMLINYDGEGGIMGAMMLFFKNPVKFFKMVMNSGWKTSWISRGMYCIGLFAILGLVHIILTFYANPTITTGVAALGSVTGVFAILMIIASFLVTLYAGLLIGYVKAIPIWGSAMMPFFFVASGFLGGAALALAGRMNNAAVLQFVQILVLIYAAVVLAYLWNAWNQLGASKYSIQQMVKGGGMLSIIFYVGVVLLGMLLPVATVIVSFVSNVSTPLLGVAIAGVLVGDLSLRYLIMKCGTYTPLITTSPY